MAKKKLKIAQIAPFWFDVPPKDYGGTERIISYLTEELVKRGHNVTLFASDKSKTKAQLVSPISSNLLKKIEYYCDPTFNAINNYVNAFVFQNAKKFDIIHSHASFFSFFFCDFVKTPTIHTIHNQLPRAREVENELFRKYNYLNFVSVSNEFRSHFDLNYVETVYHGLLLKNFPFDKKGGKNLVWVGRPSRNKGELEAIKTAKKAKEKILLVMSLRPDTANYYKAKIKPEINENVDVVFNAKFEEVWKYYSKAKAFLFPMQWEEPFGLVIIESMACGTPVIAFDRGSAGELISDEETGYLVSPQEGIDGLVRALKKLNSLNKNEYLSMRKKCRERVEKYFTTEKMADNYEKLYYKIINKSKLL